MRRLFWAVLLCCAAAAGVRAENWPSWRGPAGNGHSSEKGLPARWSATENVQWKVALPGPGNSSPIIWGDRVFLTQSLDEGGVRRALLSFDRKDGKQLWQRVVEFAGKESTHGDNPYAAGSPVTDGERVIASFGSAGLLCCDLNGKELWRKEVGKLEHIWGNASSPVIHGDLVYLNCGPGERTFLLAMNKQTGADVWRVEEPGNDGADSSKWLGSWSDPKIVRTATREELIMSWPNALKAYDPKSGRVLWTCAGLTPLVYTSPLVTPEIAVAMSGYGGASIACRIGGDGDVTASHRLWRHDRAPQRIGSGVIVGDHLYMINEPGTLQCIELKTGNTVYNERLGGSAWSSLLYADGKLYSISRQGETVIAEASPTFKMVGRCPLGEKTQASIAVSNGEMFIRTFEHLWCIGERR